MNTLMTCDDVFDVLTRQPFPSGDASDADVELHLGVCHECRCLAEALRPAVGLIHESLRENDERLPAYRGCIQEAMPIRSVSPAMAGLDSAHRSTQAPMGQVKPYLIGALISFAAMLVMWLATSRVDGESSRLGGMAGFSGQSHLRSEFGIPDNAGREMLASFGIPAICVPARAEQQAGALQADRSAGSGTVSAELQEYVCCTLCHSAHVSITRERSIRKVTLACRACHKSPPVDSVGAFLRLRVLPAC